MGQALKMSEEIDSFVLATGLIGGLALFLFGMDILTRALKLVSGSHLKTIISKVSDNRFNGVAAGAALTAIIQSSSITTVLLVGFVSAGLITTSQSVAVILGANIGTTITAQILAFKVTKFALPLLAAGFFVYFVARSEVIRQYGNIALGLGLLFFGMALMSDSMAPLHEYPPFFGLMASLNNPLLASLAGAGFTALIQSSSATTGILIVMASQGLISLETAIALALGANIGTCVTAMLAATGRSAAALRTALVHTIFNLVGVIIWIGFIEELATFARLISPMHTETSGLARSSTEIPRQIANAHTVFNVVNTMLFIGFTTQLTRLVEWLVPEKPARKTARSAPKFLDRQLLGAPELALDATRREIVRLGRFTRDMLTRTMPLAVSGSIAQLSDLQKMDRQVDQLHQEIIGYLRELSLGSLSSVQSDQLLGLIRIANDLEHIGDQIATAMVTSARKRIEENIVVTEVTAKVIGGLHGMVGKTMKDALDALEHEDRTGAEAVTGMKHAMSEMVEAIAKHELRRLQVNEPHRLKTYAREIELVEILDEIFRTARRMSQTQLRMQADNTVPEKEPEKPAEF